MKKKRSFSLPILLTACLILLGSCLQPQEKDPADTAAQKLVAPGEVTYHTEQAQYLPYICTNADPAYLKLVNRAHPLSALYVPDGLMTIDPERCSVTKDIKLEETTLNALYAMMEEMTQDLGENSLMVTSGYRDYLYQKRLYDGYLETESKTISADAYAALGSAYIEKNYIEKGLTKLSAADAKKVVDSYSAQPGCSEHQTGLCFDFITAEMTGLDLTFENTPYFTWLSENAWKFGFILRFPEGKESVTGYSYEPWHYRFVGREVAYTIYQANSTLEEFLAEQ